MKSSDEDTDLRLALGPGAVAPAVAGLHQAGLPLLQLGRAGPPVTPGGLDRGAPPPQLACTTAEEQKTRRNMNDVFTRTSSETRKMGRSERLEVCVCVCGV